MRILLVLLLLSVSVGMYGQKVTELLRIPVTEGAGTVEIGLEPKKKPSAVVVGADGNIFREDDGEWKSFPLPFTPADMKMAMDKKGDLFAVVKKNDKLVVFESGNLGESWEETGELLYEEKNSPYYAIHSDAKSGDLHLIYTVQKGDGETCRMTFHLVSTSNGGKKWTEPKVLNLEGGSCENIMVSMTSYSDGKLFCVWTDGKKLKADRSYDGERWLRNDIEMLNTFEGEMQYGTPELMIDRSQSQLGGMIYLIGSSEEEGEHRAWIRKSGNAADSWSDNQSIDKEFQGEQYFPQLAIDHTVGALYTLWYGKSEAGADIFFGYSLDGGKAFKYKKLNEVPLDSFDPDKLIHPLALAANEGRIVATWIEQHEGELVQKVVEFSQKELFKL